MSRGGTTDAAQIVEVIDVEPLRLGATDRLVKRFDSLDARTYLLFTLLLVLLLAYSSIRLGTGAPLATFGLLMGACTVASIGALMLPKLVRKAIKSSPHLARSRKWLPGLVVLTTALSAIALAEAVGASLQPSLAEASKILADDARNSST